MPCQLRWHFLNHSRATFRYQQPVIELASSQSKLSLGETAFTDLWHLSTSQVLVGNMGSRFSKVAWALATARRNNLVPYVSVDGRTPCCEIDEVCSTALASMGGMLDCLAYAHELHGVEGPSYWVNGSTQRWTSRRPKGWVRKR